MVYPFETPSEWYKKWKLAKASEEWEILKLKFKETVKLKTTRKRKFKWAWAERPKS